MLGTGFYLDPEVLKTMHADPAQDIHVLGRMSGELNISVCGSGLTLGKMARSTLNEVIAEAKEHLVYRRRLVWGIPGFLMQLSAYTGANYRA
jgi:hypothetical protein